MSHVLEEENIKLRECRYPLSYTRLPAQGGIYLRTETPTITATQLPPTRFGEVLPTLRTHAATSGLEAVMKQQTAIGGASTGVGNVLELQHILG
jgi:hypothetical protein